MNVRMATGSTSRILSGSNNLESILTHFDLLAALQKRKKAEGEPAHQIGGQQ